MPAGYPPSVFVSSTCYDLSQIRRDLKSFIESLGYEAVISENPAFPVNPQVGTIANCVNAVRDRADLFVLIIGTRYGSQTPSGRSITNLEYAEAAAKEIPIYVFVAKSIIHTLPVWKANPTADFSRTVDSSKLFEFVDALRCASGHWVYEFEEVAHIIEVLRSQWALLFTDAMASRERLRTARLSSELMTLPSAVLAILLEKPKGWEYRFFSAVLQNELTGLAALRRDLDYGLELGPVQRLEILEVIEFCRSQFERMRRLVTSASKLVTGALQEALGPPGKPGDPELLVYVARRFAEVVRQALRWTHDFSTVYVDDEFKRLLVLSSRFSKEVIDKISQFPELIDGEIEKATAAAGRGENYSGEIILKLEMPPSSELTEEFARLSQRVGGP